MSKQVTLVDAANLKTGEEAVAAFIMAMISLKSMMLFQVEAYKKGLLNDEEQEVGKTILWEIQRLLELYQKQAEMLGNRFPIDEEAFNLSLAALSKPKRRKKE